MRVLDLFSGIGGFSLGLERAGFETVAFCEIDPFCRQVLKKHWPKVPIHEDITKLDGAAYRGTVDVVCGGYPCQPFSAAGKRAGAEDDRHLWPEMFRIIKESRPAWVLCENVAGHIKLGLDSVLSDLESEGYAVQPFVIPACAVDAPHRRDRVWILANASGGRCGEQREGQIQQQGRTKAFSSSETDANPNSKLRHGSRAPGRETRRDEPANLCQTLADSDSDSGERLKPCQPDAKKWQEQGKRSAGSCGDGFRRWPAEPPMGRVANGVPRRVDRIRALGNAVVPQIPEMIGRAIMEAHYAK